MPELPEVETVARSIAPLVGRRIVSAEFRCRRVLRGANPGRMAAALAGRRIAAIERFGKFILIRLDRGYLMVHLGMTGRLLLDGPLGKHTHAILTLDRGSLVYDDSRQFGRIQYSVQMPRRLARLGPEPLEVSFDDFYARTRGRRTRIKALLLNQDFVRGIGNIYADESLFRFLSFGGQHDDGSAQPGPAQIAADLETVPAGEHYVQQDQVPRFGACPAARGHTVPDGFHFIAFGFQIVGQAECQVGIILNYQYSCHRHLQFLI